MGVRVYQFDSIVIGGGFFGTYLATKLSTNGRSCLIIEQEADLLRRASYVNQARVHNGYHYPRNYLTAFRSVINFPRFISDFYAAVDQSFEKIYAISKINSKVTSDQFWSFCKKIGAPIKKLPTATKVSLFNPQLIEDAFVVKEFAFNAIKLRSLLKKQISRRDITVQLNTRAHSIRTQKNNRGLEVLTEHQSFSSKRVFLCGYSGINTILRHSAIPILPMKHEITEMALVRVPLSLQNLAVTVMDGPFFSTMPFPDKKLHTVSHVRYTPHYYWADTRKSQKNPYEVLRSFDKRSQFSYMIRDAARFFPALSESKYVDSLFEIKTILQSSEVSDSRPILFRQDYHLPGLFVIMGGKIDNIYDITEVLKTIDSLRNYDFD